MMSLKLVALLVVCLLAIGYCIWRYIDPSDFAPGRRAKRKRRD